MWLDYQTLKEQIESMWTRTVKDTLVRFTLSPQQDHLLRHLCENPGTTLIEKREPGCGVTSLVLAYVLARMVTETLRVHAMLVARTYAAAERLDSFLQLMLPPGPKRTSFGYELQNGSRLYIETPQRELKTRTIGLDIKIIFFVGCEMTNIPEYRANHAQVIYETLIPTGYTRVEMTRQPLPLPSTDERMAPL